MKKLTIFAIVLLMVGVFSTCKKETTISFADVPEINGGADIADGTVSYTLSVQVIPSSEKGNRVSGLENAEVTVNSAGGTSTVTTGVDGIAVFSGLPGTGGVAGTASVYIDAGSGFAKRNVFVGLPAGVVSDADQTLLVQAQVIMPRLGASLVGTIWGDFDNDGITNPSETVPGVKVRVQITNTTQPNVYETTTAADGTFRIDSLPETVAGASAVVSVTYRYTNSTTGDMFSLTPPNPVLIAGATVDVVSGGGSLQITTSAPQSQSVTLIGRLVANYAYDTCNSTSDCYSVSTVNNQRTPNITTCCNSDIDTDDDGYYKNGITVTATYTDFGNPYINNKYTVTTSSISGKKGYFSFTLPVAGTVDIEVEYAPNIITNTVMDDWYAKFTFTSGSTIVSSGAFPDGTTDLGTYSLNFNFTTTP